LEKLKTYKMLDGPKGLPYFGSMFKMDIPRLHQQIEVWEKEFGGVFRLKLAGIKLIVISNPELIQKILKLRPKEFKRASKMNRIIREQGIHGLFNAENDDWEKHRSIITKGLDVKHQMQFFPELKEITKRLYRKWEKDAVQGNEIDIQQDFLRYTVDVTTSIAFGIEMNTIEEDGGVIQDHLEKIFPMIFKRINDPFAFYKIIKGKKDKEFANALKEIHLFIDDIILKGKERIANNPGLRENPGNVLEAILVAAETIDGFGDKEVKGNLLTLLMAGEDTTAHTMAWAITELVQNHSVVEALQSEVDEILGENLLFQEYDDHNRLKYTEAVANETMRLKPVAPILLNEPVKEIEVDGYLFKKGDRLVLQTRIGAKDNAYFTNAEDFNPNRWITETRCPMHNTNAFIPFGAGPRFCPGRNLALLEMKMVLSMLFKNFNVQMVSSNETIEEILAFTMMSTPYRVKLTKR
jgi:cytochrome P450